MRQHEKGGAIYGLLAAIGLIVVLMAVFFASCFSNASGQTVGMPSVERHHRDGGGDHRYRHDRGREGDGEEYGNSGSCQSGGCDNRSRRCERTSGDCRSSFSPGPFKDSPVTICLPNSCNSDGRDRGGQGQDPQPGETPR